MMAHTNYAQLLSELASYWWPIVVDAAVKGLAILLLAVLAALLMRRASAAARHLLWRLTMIGLLALPLISTALPGWNVLPDWFAPRPRSSSPVQAVVRADVVVEASTEHAQLAPSRAVTVLPPAVDVPRPKVAPNTVASGDTSGDTSGGDVIHLVGWLLVIWSLGVIASISPLLLGMLSLWRLGRQSRQVTDGPWHALLMEVSSAIGLKRSVALLVSERRSVPMVWGDWPLGRTTLLLPEVAKDWSQQRRRVVLLHELAHIKRHDCLAHLITHLACALYWFNPLIWLAAWRMQIERERACDDMVVAGGSEPSDYAEQLLHIAANLRGNLLCGSAAIAMARRSNLESRLLAILYEHRNRRTLTRFAVAVAVVLLVAVVVPVAMLRAQGPSNPVSLDASGQPVVTQTLRIHGQPASPWYTFEDKSYSDVGRVVERIEQLMQRKPFPFVEVHASLVHRTNQSVIDDLIERSRAVGFINMAFRYDLLDAATEPVALRFLSYEHPSNHSGPETRALGVYWLPNGEQRDADEERRLLGAFVVPGGVDMQPPKDHQWLYMWLAGPSGEVLLSGSAKLLDPHGKVIASSIDVVSMEPQLILEHRPWLMIRFALRADQIPPTVNVALAYRPADRPGLAVRRSYQVEFRNVALKPVIETDVPVDKSVLQAALDPIQTVKHWIELALANEDDEAAKLIFPGKANQTSDLREMAKHNQLKIEQAYANDEAALVLTDPIRGDHGRGGPILFRLRKHDGRWLIFDIDLETVEEAAAQVEGFLGHPGVRPFTELLSHTIPAMEPSLERGETNARFVCDAFYRAIVEGDDATAQGMSKAGEFPHGFDRIRETLDLAKGRIDRAWADNENACVVTTFMPRKGRDGQGAFGLSLHKVGNRWRVRDFDWLPDQQAMDKFIAGFRQVAPTATEIGPGPETRTNPVSSLLEAFGARKGKMIVDAVDGKLRFYLPGQAVNLIEIRDGNVLVFSGDSLVIKKRRVVAGDFTLLGDKGLIADRPVDEQVMVDVHEGRVRVRQKEGTSSFSRIELKLQHGKVRSLRALGGRVSYAPVIERPLKSQAASFGKHILLGCIMYASDHDGKWPDDLSALRPYLPGDGDPASGWVYIKPSMPHGKLAGAAETLMIYQAFEQWQGGIYAGFADGHVALIGDEDRLKQLLSVEHDREK